VYILFFEYKTDRFYFLSAVLFPEAPMTILKHLFSPIRIGRMRAKNRLLMSAMSINFGVDENGYVTEQLTGYLAARARGGAGMILVGGGGVHPTGLELPGLPALWDDACIPALKKMVETVKPFDTCFGVQLMHGGRQSYHDRKVAPSPIPAPAVVKGIPKELTVEEIAELVSSFGDAARRCRDAGFDFVEVHGAHGYLINQFLSPIPTIVKTRMAAVSTTASAFSWNCWPTSRPRPALIFPWGCVSTGKTTSTAGGRWQTPCAWHRF
jgi:hypothetical protein